MSDPDDPNPRPLRNPPGARRRGRRARANQQGPAEDDAPVPLAPAPETSPAVKPPAGRGRAPAAAPAEKAKETESSAPRGMVCRNCGKYHDISTRLVGDEFECKCGAQLIVPPPREAAATRPHDVTLRIRELRNRNRLSMVSMLIGFAVCIVLLSAALYLLGTAQSYVSGTCAAIAALGFLVLAVIATSEWRRTNSELAEQEGADLP